MQNRFGLGSVALGKATIENIPVISISAQSTLGSRLIGLKVGDVCEMNKAQYIIEGIP